MIDPATTQRELIAIAQQIEISDTTKVDPLAQRLRDLSEAIMGSAYTDAWAAIDVHRLIEPAVIVERYSNRQRRNRWIAYVQWTRNILLFLLFIFSSIGVLLAVQAHTMLVSKQPDTASQSFLSLWEGGFQNSLGQQRLLGIQLPLWNWFVPVHLVIGDILLLLLITLLTGFLIWFKQWSHTKRTLEAEQLREKLTRILADASLCLASVRWKGPTNLVSRFDETADRLLQEMQAERERLAELANRREKEFADLAAFSTGVSRVTNGMLVAAEKQAETTNKLLQGLHIFTEQFKDIPPQQHALLLSINQALHLLQQSINLLGDIKSSQEQRLESLSRALTQLGESVEHIMEYASVQKSSTEEYVEQQRLFFQNIQAERELQNKVVLRIISATENTGKVLQEMNESAKSVHMISVDLTNMRNRLVAFLNTMKDEIFEDLKGAADQITNSGTSLANAAKNIEQASQSLAQSVLIWKKEALYHAVDGADNELIDRVITAKLGEHRPTDADNVEVERTVFDNTAGPSSFDD